MINQTLLWLLALPIVLGIGLFACRRTYEDVWVPCLMFVAFGMLITGGVFLIAKGGKTQDIEIWNGKVISKERNHGEYEESYECRCRTEYSTETRTRTKTDSKGKTSTETYTVRVPKKVCDTCYRTHYTVKWDANTTVGSYRIDSEDSLSRLVYNTKDPERYTRIRVGDPAARASSYTNYIQAVPNSLFAPAPESLRTEFAALLPPYPDKVFDFYRINRFLTPGWTTPEADAWNEDISLAMRDVGPAKQVNLIVVIAKTNDVAYEYALRDHWEGANKNDVVLLIGSTAWPKIDFVRVISWTKNEAFKIQLRDKVIEKGTIDRGIVNIALAQIQDNFERRRMREFEYLEGEIDPPDWLVTTLIAILLAASVGLFIYIPNLCANGRMRRGIYRRS